MTSHPLTMFEIQKCHRNEPRFNEIYSKNDLPKKKDGAYIINLDYYKSIETLWIALYMSGDNMTYFDSFEVEHILKEIKELIGNKNITKNIFRKQVFGSITCGYFCSGFIDFMLKGKSLLEYTNLFSLSKHEKN